AGLREILADGRVTLTGAVFDIRRHLVAVLREEAGPLLEVNEALAAALAVRHFLESDVLFLEDRAVVEKANNVGFLLNERRRALVELDAVARVRVRSRRVEARHFRVRDQDDRHSRRRE